MLAEAQADDLPLELGHRVPDGRGAIAFLDQVRRGVLGAEELDQRTRTIRVLTDGSIKGWQVVGVGDLAGLQRLFLRAADRVGQLADRGRTAERTGQLLGRAA